ncbi:hypothetical protein ABEF95_006560 [Exophiala dermatitidis]
MIYDVAIIGAGPCGLAVASRLRESTPSALFTDDEHARYWKRFSKLETIESERKRNRRTEKKNNRTGSQGSNTSNDSEGTQNNSNASNSSSEEEEDDKGHDKSIIVLDAHSNEWMSAWKEKFRNLQIDHLRSPLFFHPDPRDRDGLLAFSHFSGRTPELEEIQNVVGREISKHQAKKSKSRGRRQVSRHLRIDDRDRIDYYTPSSQLFEDFCRDIIERYRLRNLIHQARVQTIEYGDVGGLFGNNLFSLVTDSKETILARTVVLAVGPGAKPSIPRDCNLRLETGTGSVCHCFDSTGGTCLPEHVARKIEARVPTCVVVVGGGLTSAQIADLMIRRGVRKVFLLLRGKYKLKHFDVDLEWVSKLRNQQMSVFWSADTDEERFQFLAQARNGGSITPKYDKILRKHVASGAVTILTQTCITRGTWAESSQTWSLDISPPHPGFADQIDHIVYATGVPPKIENVACMQEILERHPIKAINGLPCINNDLMWNDDVPLFLTGGLAGLRLGPGAGNLAGARQGAERIAWKIDELLEPDENETPNQTEMILDSMGEKKGRKLSSQQGNQGSQGWKLNRKSRLSMEQERSEFTGGFANQFQALATVEGY